MSTAPEDPTPAPSPSSRIARSALPGDTGAIRKGKEPSPVPADLDPDDTLPRQQRRFDRTARIVGDEAMARLLRSHVVVFGVGGVGSFCIEALVRSGVGRLTLVDFDDVCVTNTNRQLHALKNTVGAPKVEVMAARARLINPRLVVETREAFYGEATADELLPDDLRPDFVVDAIDNITAKVHLLDRVRTQGIPCVSSMGAAAKTDPTKIRVADLKDSYNDPFARDIRGILRRKYGWDMSAGTGLPVVFSTERPVKPTALYYDQATGGFQCVCPPKEDRGHSCDDRLQIEGTLGFVTGAFGLACASVVVNTLTGRPPEL
jgi:tRNA A37 threonylcarbamoyladenosine dehydratase